MMAGIDLSDRSKVLAIIGQGYVGLPLAMAAVDAGWAVIGIEKSASRVEQLNSGSSPVEDVSDERLARAIAAKKFVASNDPADVAHASVVTICVPTPLDDSRNPDLALLESATKDVSPYLSDGTLLVSESTSYPGTLREVIIPLVDKLKPKETIELFYASAPERVNPGDPVWDQKNTPRLVGGIDEESQKRALAFYNSICDSVVVTSTPEIAEAAKILENTFRLVNIAMIN
jgi:UDP-N-acetyl-D-glucosamine dehydrogenase